LETRKDSLAGRLRAGDHQAADELVEQYYEQIYLFMRRLGCNRGVSEDLTQESFLSAWQNIGQLKDDSALKSWFYRIAGNVSKMYWRRRKGKVVVGLEDFEVLDDSEDVREEVEHTEQLGRLHTAVTGLSMKLRQAIVLHYMQHLTIAEAAEAAGVRKGTFKSRLNRAIKMLRKQVIGDNGELL
jgi:RNA polymerase sigma-70 factor (ECF subfamily)